jgi:short-subunit dehydrogenase
MTRAHDDFRIQYGPWALIAGASVGLGAEFARQLAAQGLDLVLVARRAGPLEAHACALAAEFGVQARVVTVDLADPDVMRVIGERTSDIEVGLRVYNAAFSPIGCHLEQNLADKVRVIDVKRGGIILMSSMAGLQGSALIATYAATKAYNLVLGEGLWDELREHGVDVLAFCAGATRTPNYEESRPKKTGFFSAPMEPDTVVSQALATLGKRPSAVAGRTNRIAEFVMTRLLPRRVAIEIMGKAMRSMYPK